MNEDVLFPHTGEPRLVEIARRVRDLNGKTRTEINWFLLEVKNVIAGLGTPTLSAKERQIIMTLHQEIQ